VRIGENRIWGDYPNFNLKTAEQDVGLDLKYQAQLPGFAINSGRVTYGSTDDFYSVYVTLPRAKITGTVRTPTGTRQVSGFGYSDHGIVTMLPHEYSKRWLTLRCFHSKYTLDFLEFTVPAKWGGQRVAMTIFGAGDKILYGGSRYTLTPSDWRTEPKFKQTYPQRFDFVIDRPGKIKVEGTYTMKTQMHSIDLLSQLTLIERQIASLFAKSYIVRFVAEVDAKVTFPDGTTDSFKSPAVAEVLHLL
jgi:predicted secreted hydrolase